MELNLTELREEINKIDEDIVELFKRRMDIAASVAEYKKEHSLPVLDAAREEALLERISQMAGDELGSYARTLYHTMLDVSKAYQQTILSPEVSGAIESTKKTFPDQAQVACRDVEGERSEIIQEG